MMLGTDTGNVPRKKLAVYWGAACGGCEMALLALDHDFLTLLESWELVFCPCLMDAKKSDVESMEDGSIDLVLFNGAVRNDENEEMALLLRRKAQQLVAFGSCAHEGCVPGLANLFSARKIIDGIYRQAPELDNPEGTVPSECSTVPEGMLSLPRFHERVQPLSRVTLVDAAIPGCPPEPGTIRAALAQLVDMPSGSSGAVLGCGASTVCCECPRSKLQGSVTAFKRVHHAIPDSQSCLLSQGILCRGIATRQGCGALCPQVNMPCSGCYGAPHGYPDQGAAMVAGLAGVLELELCNYGGAGVETLLDALPDLAGSVYLYSLATSGLKRDTP